MRILFAILCIVLLGLSFVVGCKPPGMICAEDKDCCGPLICNSWAGRCTPKMGPPLSTNPPESSKAPADEKQK